MRPALQAETCPGALRLRRVAALSGCDVSLKAPGRFPEMRMCTCAYAQARAQARTHRLTHMQMPHRRSPSPTAQCLSFAARSRRGRPDTSASARPRRPLAPARQRSRRLTRREGWYTKALADAADWRGMAAQDRQGGGSCRADFDAEQGCEKLCPRKGTKFSQHPWRANYTAKLSVHSKAHDAERVGRVQQRADVFGHQALLRP